MNEYTNRNIIDKWVAENGPNGLAKLSAYCGVSTRLLAVIRSGSLKYPKRYSTRKKICDFLNVKHVDLFPGVLEPY